MLEGKELLEKAKLLSK